MYNGCCCYCESKIKSASYPEIEHFKPKSKYPELCFNYSNLHYSCKRFNLTKGSYYNNDLISPSDENQEEHIRYIGELAISIDNAVIYDLEKKIRMENLSNYSYDGIVEGYFEVDSYSKELKEKIEEYKSLVYRNDLNEDESARRAELRIELKNASGDLAIK